MNAMLKPSLILLSLVTLCSCATKPDNVRPLDDSYTISQRYDGYKDKYAGIEWPVTEFMAGQKVYFDQRYEKIGNRELRIDTFLPPPNINKHKAILLVHGGAWRSGSKSHFYNLANRMAQKGYVVFIPEYRLSPEIGYPAGLFDINNAIVWAKSHAAEFDFDKNELAIGGASSGGQMAALIAYTYDTDLFKEAGQDTKVSALIDLDGVLDFTTPLALNYENAAKSKSVAAKWLGGSMEQVPNKWHEASATTHLGKNSPPTLIICSGIERFTAGKEEVFQTLNGLKIRNDYYEFKDAPHDIWLFEPYLGKIADKIDGFLSPETAK